MRSNYASRALEQRRRRQRRWRWRPRTIGTKSANAVERLRSLIVNPISSSPQINRLQYKKIQFEPCERHFTQKASFRITPPTDVVLDTIIESSKELYRFSSSRY